MAGTPVKVVIAGGWPYTIRVRLSAEHRASLDAIESTVFNSASGHTASLGSVGGQNATPLPHEEKQPEHHRIRFGLQPGNYTVRLTVDGKTYTQPVTVKPDPRSLPVDAEPVPERGDDGM